MKPYKMSGDTLTSQIDNLNTRMSSNIDLGQISSKILARQVDQQGNNNDINVSENVITDIRPSEISSSSSISLLTAPNFEIPVLIDLPVLSNTYHETSKISDMSSLSEINNLDSSIRSDDGFQLWEFSGLSGSISEEGLNLVDSLGGLNEKNENAFRKEFSGKIGENKIHILGKVNDHRRGHKSR